MRMVVEVRLEDNAGSNAPIRLVEFERADGELNQLGYSLAEGKHLVHEAQRALVNAQAHGFASASKHCLHRGAALSMKSKHTNRYRTVFGKVAIDSPQLRVCKCSRDMSRKSFSPLAAALPGRLSPKLEYLQVKWAAHLPDTVATALLKETLPVDQAIRRSPSLGSLTAYGRLVKNWTTPPKVPFAVNVPTRPRTARSKLSPWRWIRHGYATAPRNRNRNRTKTNWRGISSQSWFRPLGVT